MEIGANPFDKSSRRFGKRSKYQRLNGGNNKKSMKIVKIGDDQGKKKSWRIRIPKRLRFKMVSPAKLWSKLKNSYLKMMLNLAGNIGVGNLRNSSVFPGRKLPIKASQVSNGLSCSREEFHDRLVYEIYKNLMPSWELATV